MFHTPATRSFRKRIADVKSSVLLDSIVGSFNGSATSFSLKAAGKAVIPSTSQNLLVVLGGVVQSPNLAYSISSSTITFASAPPTSEDCFMILSGGQVNACTTISLIANSGFASNSSGIFANLAVTSGLQFASGGLQVFAGNGAVVNSSGVCANLLANNTFGGIQFNGGGLCILANNGISANSTGTFANLAATNPALGFTSGGLNVLGANGISLTSTGVNVLVNNGMISNTTGVWIQTGNGLTTNTSGLQLIANTNVTINSTGIFASGGGSPGTSLYFGNI